MKIKKILSTLAVVFITVLGLSACKGNGEFYENYFEAGATNLTEDHIFKEVSLSDVKKMKENKEDFILFLGSYELSTDVAGVNQIAYDAKVKGYDGKLLYLELAEYKTRTKVQELNEVLNIKFDNAPKGLICVNYATLSEGYSLVFETTRPERYEITKGFITDTVSEAIDIHAVAAYAFDFNNNLKK